MRGRGTDRESDRGETPLEHMVNLAGIAGVLGVSKRTVERWRAAGVLPQPDLTIGRVKRWKLSTLWEWMAERHAAKP